MDIRRGIGGFVAAGLVFTGLALAGPVTPSAAEPGSTFCKSEPKFEDKINQALAALANVLQPVPDGDIGQLTSAVYESLSLLEEALNTFKQPPETITAIVPGVVEYLGQLKEAAGYQNIDQLRIVATTAKLENLRAQLQSIVDIIGQECQWFAPTLAPIKTTSLPSTAATSLKPSTSTSTTKPSSAASTSKPATTTKPSSATATSKPATTTKPSTTRSSSLPSTSWPASTIPSTTKPPTSATKPSTSKPSTSQPATTKPSTTRPSTTPSPSRSVSTPSRTSTAPSTARPSTTDPILQPGEFRPLRVIFQAAGSVFRTARELIRPFTQLFFGFFRLFG